MCHNLRLPSNNELQLIMIHWCASKETTNYVVFKRRTQQHNGLFTHNKHKSSHSPPQPDMSNSKVSDSGPYEVENCRGVLRVFSDGSISRSEAPLADTPLSDDGSVIWDDVLYDSQHNLHLRRYTPKSTPTNLPVVFYIHGGGFCIGSRTWPNFHNFCFRLSAHLPAVVIAPDYRLAPENKIPDSIDDCFNALRWTRDQLGDESADLNKVFVVGDSAGGTIAHNLALRLGGDGGAREELGIRGYILLDPFFGGTERTKSEVDGSKDTFLNLDLIDRYWRLSIPEGDNTDHPMVNPFGPRSPSLKDITVGPILVTASSNDLLRDRIVQYANMLRELGKDVEHVEFPGKDHGFYTFDPDSSEANEMMLLLKSFISKNSL